MKKLIAILLLVCLLMQVTPAVLAAENPGSISIELSETNAKVGDIVVATITLKDMDPFIITLPIHFNPKVLQVVNNSGQVVRSGIKTAAEIRDGSAGVITGQALSGDMDGSGNQLYWNGAIFDNPQYPYLDNDKGLYKFMFSDGGKRIVSETIISLRFAVVGEGSSEVRFATSRDAAHDGTSVAGAVYFNDSEMPQYPATNTARITTTAGGIPPVIEQGGTGGGGGSLPPTMTVTFETADEALAYEVPEKVIENALARAANETGGSMNIAVNAGANVNEFVIKVPISAVRKAQAAFVSKFTFDTPIGVIGFKTPNIFAQAGQNSEFVILTLKGNLNCSIAIDQQTIQGCLLGFHTENIASTAFFNGKPIMKSNFDGKTLLFYAATSGSYTMQAKTVNFPDLPSSHWAYGNVQSLVAKNVVSGLDNGTFAPESNITREQFAKMIVEALGLYDASATCAFSDLAQNHWAYGYVASAVKAGIINGYGDGSFGVGKNITRQEIAAIISRLDIRFPVLVTPTAFTDSAKIADWARDGVQKMQMANIISGFVDGSFQPEANASRSQAARIIFGVLGVLD